MHYVEVVPRSHLGFETASLTYHSPLDLPIGSVVSVPIGRRQGAGVVVAYSAQPPFPTREAIPLLDEKLPLELLRTLQWLGDYYAVSLSQIMKNVLPAGLGRVRRTRPPTPANQARHLPGLKLTPEQARAAHTLINTKGSAILHGATGSGKTLVYRELARATLAAGRSVLILVPEIGLTTQAASDFSDLSTHLFVLHSDLTEAARHALWLQILQRRLPKIVIGPRSALFAPLANIGQIIVDEAHETAYKQDTSPRYHALAVATRLSREHSSRLLFGSATPRVSDVYVAEQTRQTVVELPRFSGKNNISITTVNRLDKSKFTTSQVLSNELITTLEETRAAGKQSLLYLNRRGTSTLALCQACGWQALCPNCALPLTHHHDRHRLICHTCGRQESVPPVCPDCSSPDILYKGAGTKRIEQELKKLFPEAGIARFDADAASEDQLHKQYHKLLGTGIDFIVGTQMVARGIDLPNLETVGVILAETEIMLPDFSASERAFQLLYQVIGRAGRRRGGGRVIIQTFNPDHPAIRFATAQDYRGFYGYELSERRTHRYPPFSYLLQMTCSYASRPAALKAAELAKKLIHERFGVRAVLGPAPAFHERRGRTYRWNIVVKSPRRAHLLEIARYFQPNPKWQVDLDPINLLS